MTNTILKDEEFIAKKEVLREIATDKKGWLIYFIDLDSNRWVQEYPNSEYHGGGNTQLRLIEKFPWEKNLNYKVNFLIARKIINDFDPCGLIESGSPIDEYDFMTNKVLSFVYNKKNIKIVTEDISKELIDSFSLDISENDSEKLKYEIEQVLINVLIKLSNQITTTNS